MPERVRRGCRDSRRPRLRAGATCLLSGLQGQFIDHDLVATVDEDSPSAPTFDIEMAPKRKRRPAAVMELHRLVADREDDCRAPVVVNTPTIDAGTIYSNNDDFLRYGLREPGSCKLRTSPGGLPPVAEEPNALGKYVFVAGDSRGACLSSCGLGALHCRKRARMRPCPVWSAANLARTHVVDPLIWSTSCLSFSA